MISFFMKPSQDKSYKIVLLNREKKAKRHDFHDANEEIIID